MYRKKLLVTLLIIAIIGTFAAVLGCTTPSPEAAGLTGSIEVLGSTSVQPYATELADSFMAKYPGTRVLVSGGGSSAGVKAAQDGTAAIGTSSRDLTQAEKGSGLKEIVIAYDGIAVVVHKDNAVADLTKAQIKDIFTGAITNWQDVGGANARIVVVNREAASGTRTAFAEIVLGKGVNFTTGADVIEMASTGGVTQTVAGNTNAIGYVSFGSMDDSVKAMKVGGVAPSAATIKDKTYPVQRPFLYVTMGETTNAVARAFIEYTLSAEGQGILEAGKLVTI